MPLLELRAKQLTPERHSGRVLASGAQFAAGAGPRTDR